MSTDASTQHFNVLTPHSLLAITELLPPYHSHISQMSSLTLLASTFLLPTSSDFCPPNPTEPGLTIISLNLFLLNSLGNSQSPCYLISIQNFGLFETIYLNFCNSTQSVLFCFPPQLSSDCLSFLCKLCFPCLLVSLRAPPSCLMLCSS